MVGKESAECVNTDLTPVQDDTQELIPADKIKVEKLDSIDIQGRSTSSSNDEDVKPDIAALRKILSLRTLEQEQPHQQQTVVVVFPVSEQNLTNKTFSEVLSKVRTHHLSCQPGCSDGTLNLVFDNLTDADHALEMLKQSCDSKMVIKKMKQESFANSKSTASSNKLETKLLNEAEFEQLCSTVFTDRVKLLRNWNTTSTGEKTKLLDEIERLESKLEKNEEETIEANGCISERRSFRHRLQQLRDNESSLIKGTFSQVFCLATLRELRGLCKLSNKKIMDKMKNRTPKKTPKMTPKKTPKKSAQRKTKQSPPKGKTENVDVLKDKFNEMCNSLFIQRRKLLQIWNTLSKEKKAELIQRIHDIESTLQDYEEKIRKQSNDINSYKSKLKSMEVYSSFRSFQDGGFMQIMFLKPCSELQDLANSGKTKEQIMDEFARMKKLSSKKRASSTSSSHDPRPRKRQKLDHRTHGQRKGFHRFHTAGQQRPGKYSNWEDSDYTRQVWVSESRNFVHDESQIPNSLEPHCPNTERYYTSGYEQMQNYEPHYSEGYADNQWEDYKWFDSDHQYEKIWKPYGHKNSEWSGSEASVSENAREMLLGLCQELFHAGDETNFYRDETRQVDCYQENYGFARGNYHHGNNYDYNRRRMNKRQIYGTWDNWGHQRYSHSSRYNNHGRKHHMRRHHYR